MLIAIGIEDDWPAAELLLKAIGIKLGLLLANTRIALGTLGFNEGKRPAVIAPQYIIDESLAGIVGHASHRELPVTLLVERPAGFMQKEIDERIAGLRLAVIVRIRSGQVFVLGRRDLCLEARNLCFQLLALLLGLNSSGFG